MARPHKQGLDYFPHDVDASNDEKIEAMETLYGASGYAFYFKLAERIYRAGGELSIGDDVTKDTLAKKCLCTREEFDKMLASAIKFELFDAKIFETRFLLTSSGIKKRCKQVFSERRRSSKAKKNKRLGDGVFHAENTGITPNRNADSFRESKEKESKEENRKEKKKKIKNVLAHVDPAHLVPAKPDPDNIPATRELIRQFTPPTREDVAAYCRDRGKGVNAERWWDFYAGKGWMVGKNKMKDWQAACRTWENEDGKVTGTGERGAFGAQGKVGSGAGVHRSAKNDGEYPESLSL